MRGSGCPTPPHWFPNGTGIWPVASFLAGFSPRKKAGIPEGFPAAKVGLKEGSVGGQRRKEGGKDHGFC